MTMDHFIDSFFIEMRLFMLMLWSWMVSIASMFNYKRKKKKGPLDHDSEEDTIVSFILAPIH